MEITLKSRLLLPSPSKILDSYKSFILRACVTSFLTFMDKENLSYIKNQQSKSGLIWTLISSLNAISLNSNSTLKDVR